MTLALPSPFHLIDLESVTSTNDIALEHADMGAPAWSIVRAVEQVAGRGRRGKTFASPPGNSYTSFLLRPGCEIAQASQIALVAGLAVAQSIKLVAPDLPPARCKWPNDVLVDQHKVCGILVEAVSKAEKLEAVIVGIGVNLENHPDLEGVAISSLRELGGDVSRDAWLESLAPRFYALTQTWLEAGFSAIRQDWIAHAAGLETAVTHTDGHRPPLRGCMKGIDNDGALLIADGNGRTHRCVSGSLLLDEVA